MKTKIYCMVLIAIITVFTVMTAVFAGSSTTQDGEVLELPTEDMDEIASLIYTYLDGSTSDEKLPEMYVLTADTSSKDKYTSW